MTKHQPSRLTSILHLIFKLYPCANSAQHIRHFVIAHPFQENQQAVEFCEEVGHCVTDVIRVHPPWACMTGTNQEWHYKRRDLRQWKICWPKYNSTIKIQCLTMYPTLTKLLGFSCHTEHPLSYANKWIPPFTNIPGAVPFVSTFLGRFFSHRPLTQWVRA